MTVVWKGIMPAITTPFGTDREIDLEFLVNHARWLVQRCNAAAVIPLGSLGEGATLGPDEKRALLKALVEGLDGLAPVVPGIGTTATRDAVALAQYAQEVGCGGLMVLPPYVHGGDPQELRAHFDAVIGATELPCMLYNNPIAYGADVLPPQIAELAQAHSNLVAVKESSGDVRRITAIDMLLRDRLSVFVGLDDIAVEGVRAGATGWVAGVVNALPEASAQLFESAVQGQDERCDALYRWLLPLLRMDTVPEFVQLIKLMQQEVDQGHERVRLPRLALRGAAREQALTTIREALAAQPKATR